MTPILMLPTCVQTAIHLYLRYLRCAFSAATILMFFTKCLTRDISNRGNMDLDRLCDVSDSRTNGRPLKSPDS